MKKSKDKNYFHPDKVQKRLENKIDTYCKSFKDPSIRNTIGKMPKNQETLDVIEQELQTYLDQSPVTGDSNKEKWGKLLDGIQTISKVAKKDGK